PYATQEISALVVSQTLSTHLKIEKLLDDLRQLRRTGPSMAETARREKLQKVLEVLGDHARPTLQINSPEFRKAIARSNDFGFNLFRQVAQQQDRNQMLSGYGAREMLALAACGAEGTTQEELTKVLSLPTTRGEIAQQMMVIRMSVASRRGGS